jgi:hypothetical protein
LHPDFRATYIKQFIPDFGFSLMHIFECNSCLLNMKAS